MQFNHIIRNEFLKLLTTKISIALYCSYKYLSLLLGTKITTWATIAETSQHFQSQRKKKPLIFYISVKIFIRDQVWRGNRNIDDFYHYFVPSNNHVTFLDQCLCQKPFTGIQRPIQIRKCKKKTVREQ